MARTLRGSAGGGAGYQHLGPSLGGEALTLLSVLLFRVEVTRSVSRGFWEGTERADVPVAPCSGLALY